MKKPMKLILFLTSLTVLFSCECVHEDMSMFPEQDFMASVSMHELSELVPSEPLTVDQRQMLGEAIAKLVNQDVYSLEANANVSSDKSDEKLHLALTRPTEEEAMAHYKKMMEAHPEIKGLPLDKQLEVLYGINLSDIEALAKGGDDQGRSDSFSDGWFWCKWLRS